MRSGRHNPLPAARLQLTNQQAQRGRSANHDPTQQAAFLAGPSLPNWGDQPPLQLPYAVLGLVIFALYYLVPLVLCALEGALITANAAQKLLPPQITWLAKQVGDHPAVTLPYLRDSTHLLMAVVISIGGAVAALACSTASMGLSSGRES